jgi:outer membrane protein assembly factor BamB
MCRRLALTALVCCLSFVGGVWATLSPAAAQEWTRFRGPNGAGQSDATTIPEKWTDADYNWTAKLPGVGHSSPVLWDKKIFLTSANPKDGTRIVLCVNAADGSIAWKREFASTTTTQLHLQNSYASSTPALDDQHVYVAWASPEEYTLLALDHDGRDVWKLNLGPFVSQHGFGTSPIVYKDLVIITNDQDGESFMIAVKGQDGQTKWKIPRKLFPGKQNASYAAPCIYQPPQGPPQLIVNSWAYGIGSYDPITGQTLWNNPVFPLRPVGSPIITEAGLILGNCGEGAGNNTVIAIRPGPDPQVVYKIDKNSAPYVPTLLAYGDLVFLWADKGIVTCIDAATGQQHWRERVGGNYAGSPIRVGDRIYCISSEGDVVVLAAADKYQLISKQSLGEPSHATPAVSDGVMYLRTESQLFSLGGKK